MTGMTDPVEPPASPALLFTPIRLRDVTLRNRLVISPMVQYRARDGLCGDYHLVHLGKFAMGGAGLVFTEATAVTERGRITHGDLGIWSEDHVEAFRRLTAFLHDFGAAAGLQIGHAGRKSSMQSAPAGNGPLGPADFARGHRPWPIDGVTGEPVGPGWLVPHALTAAEIAGIVEEFAEAARRADRAGFDVLEIHGAHGYLIATFLSPVTNTRGDAYGGDRQGRMRLALEVTEAVRAAWPSGKPLFFRASVVDGAQEGWTLEDTIALAGELRRLGIDVVDCSSGGLSESATASRVPRGPGFQVPFAAAVRERAQIRTQAVGLIVRAEQAEAILRDGKADLVAVGRQALCDPFLAAHWAAELGVETAGTLLPEEYSWWLDRRPRL